MVSIEEGEPFVVPSGARLVVTSVGLRNILQGVIQGETYLRVNGATIQTVRHPNGNQPLQQFGTGLRVEGGSLVEVETDFEPGRGVALGYVIRNDDNSRLVDCTPPPRDHVRLTEEPFAVPTGKLLVIKNLMFRDPNGGGFEGHLGLVSDDELLIRVNLERTKVYDLGLGMVVRGGSSVYAIEFSGGGNETGNSSATAHALLYDQ